MRAHQPRNAIPAPIKWIVILSAAKDLVSVPALFCGNLFFVPAGVVNGTEELFQTLQLLVEAWCDRRCLRALRHVLQGYPLSSPLTDGWSELLLALQNVRAFARSELTEAERAALEDCIRAVDRIVYRR